VLPSNLARASETKFNNTEYSNKFKSASILFHLSKFRKFSTLSTYSKFE